MAQSEMCVIGPGIRINGRISGRNALAVHGQVEGTVSLEAALRVEEGATVVADVEATTVVVRGALSGNVQASESIRIEDGARVIGDLRTPRLSIAEGAIFKGSVDMDVSLPPVQTTEG
ncbi:MAG: polymer-forming cytoskeletal protein [Deltaproteobacteria bacterium]|nr:MAG: polymer-forming cytoskeletal protein [Deltaproteobacteria bacterium]